MPPHPQRPLLLRAAAAFAIISLPFAFVCSLFALVLFLFSSLAHFYDA